MDCGRFFRGPLVLHVNGFGPATRQLREKLLSYLPSEYFTGIQVIILVLPTEVNLTHIQKKSDLLEVAFLQNKSSAALVTQMMIF